MIIIVMLIGAGFVYIFLQKLYGKMWNRDLHTDIHFSTNHAVAGETVELVEIVTNKKWLPIPYIHVKFHLDRSLIFEDGGDNAQISDKTYRNDIFSLLMYQRVTRRIPIQCSKRGVYSIDKMEMVSTGIFMNEVMVMNRPVNTEITVYPIIADTDRIEVAFSKLMGTIERNRHINEDPFAFRGIRDYVPQDPMNTINWKASARTGTFLVNQFNETMCQEVCILLNVEPESMLIKDYLSEASISIAAGLAQMLIEKGIEVSLVSNACDVTSKEYITIDSASGFSHINTINTALARIDLSVEKKDFISILNYDKRILNNSRNAGHSGFETNNTLYVLISQNRRKDLQQAFGNFTGGRKDCMWITVHEKNEYIPLEYSNAQQVDWEVM